MIERVEAIMEDLEKIRKETPLTGYVTGLSSENSIANLLLATGGAPHCFYSEQNMDDSDLFCSSFFLIARQLDAADREYGSRLTALYQNQGLPVIFDPSGIADSAAYAEFCRSFLSEQSPAVVKGSASDILALRALTLPFNGEEERGTDPGVQAAHQLSEHLKCVVVISGERSYVIEGARESLIRNGAPLMERIVDTQGYATALCALFCGVNPDPYEACVNAMFVLGIAAEIGTQDSDGPGTYHPRFLDALANMTKAQILLK